MSKEGVIYIGDRYVGKTHLVLELASPKNQYVEVLEPSYDMLKLFLAGSTQPDGQDAVTVSMVPTDMIDSRFMQIQAMLPAGTQSIDLQWVDTPGEIWRASWQQDNTNEWKNFLEDSRRSGGILLILQPFREMLLPQYRDDPQIASEYPRRAQWCKRFEQWVDFFRQECPNARHIVMCLNKADLFLPNIGQVADQLQYHPTGSQLSWRKRHAYVAQRYFQPVQRQIEQINENTKGLSVQCFVTSIYNRSLLELPWVYLASFLSDSTSL